MRISIADFERRRAKYTPVSELLTELYGYPHWRQALPAIDELVDCIRYALATTNHFVYELSKTHELLRGMGTTMLCLYFHEEICTDNQVISNKVIMGADRQHT